MLLSCYHFFLNTVVAAECENMPKHRHRSYKRDPISKQGLVGWVKYVYNQRHIQTKLDHFGIYVWEATLLK